MQISLQNCWTKIVGAEGEPNSLKLWSQKTRDTFRLLKIDGVIYLLKVGRHKKVSKSEAPCTVCIYVYEIAKPSKYCTFTCYSCNTIITTHQYICGSSSSKILIYTYFHMNKKNVLITFVLYGYSRLLAVKSAVNTNCCTFTCMGYKMFWQLFWQLSQLTQ